MQNKYVYYVLQIIIVTSLERTNYMLQVECNNVLLHKDANFALQFHDTKTRDSCMKDLTIWKICTRLATPRR